MLIELLDRARRAEALEIFATSASRMARSSSPSVVMSVTRISG
jgi:hypothetical protein